MLEQTRLEKRRIEILDKMRGIKTLRKGTINEQYILVKHKNGDSVKKGPYFILTKKGAGGKTNTTTIPADKLELFKNEVGNYREFRSLAEEYIHICEQAAALPAGNGLESDEKVKKNKKSL